MLRRNHDNVMGKVWLSTDLAVLESSSCSVHASPLQDSITSVWNNFFVYKNI